MILQLKKKKRNPQSRFPEKQVFRICSIYFNPTQNYPNPLFFSLQKGNLSSLYQNLSFLLQLFLVVAEYTVYLEYFFFFFEKNMTWNSSIYISKYQFECYDPFTG